MLVIQGTLRLHPYGLISCNVSFLPSLSSDSIQRATNLSTMSKGLQKGSCSAADSGIAAQSEAHLNRSINRCFLNEGPPNNRLLTRSKKQDATQLNFIIYVTAKQLLTIHQVSGRNFILRPAKLHNCENLHDQHKRSGYELSYCKGESSCGSDFICFGNCF
jgi:hypothetical protein